MVTTELVISVSALAVALLCLFMLFIGLIVVAARVPSAPVTPAPPIPDATSTYMLSYVVLTDRSSENERVPPTEQVHGTQFKISFKVLTGVTRNTNITKVFFTLIHMHDCTDIIPVAFSALPSGCAATMPQALTLAVDTIQE